MRRLLIFLMLATMVPITQLLRVLELPVYRGERFELRVYDKFDVYSGEHTELGGSITWRW